MSLSDFHLLKNSLIKAMRIERDEIPRAEKSIDDCNQSFQDLQMQLDKSESSLKRWESRDPMSTGLIRLRRRQNSDRRDEIERLRKKSRSLVLTFLIAAIGTVIALFFFWRALVPDVDADQSLWEQQIVTHSDGFIDISIATIVTMGGLWRVHTFDERREKKIKRADDAILEITREINAVKRRLDEDNSKSLSKKRSYAKADMKKAKKRRDAGKKNLVAARSKLDNLRHKKRELIESVSHLIPYSENLS